MKLTLAQDGRTLSVVSSKGGIHLLICGQYTTLDTLELEASAAINLVHRILEVIEEGERHATI